MAHRGGWPHAPGVIEAPVDHISDDRLADLRGVQRSDPPVPAVPVLEAPKQASVAPLPRAPLARTPHPVADPFGGPTPFVLKPAVSTPVVVAPVVPNPEVVKPVVTARGRHRRPGLPILVFRGFAFTYYRLELIAAVVLIAVFSTVHSALS